jgi:hypothetical protein
VDLNFFVQAQAPHHPDDPSARTVVLPLGQVELIAMKGGNTDGDGGYFTNVGAQHHHGVRLPHLLEHLKIWGDPDD